MPHLKTVSIVIAADETPATLKVKLDNLNIDHSHLSLDQELKEGFKGKTIRVSYDNRDMKWLSTVWNNPQD